MVSGSKGCTNSTLTEPLPLNHYQNHRTKSLGNDLIPLLSDSICVVQSCLLVAAYNNYKKHINVLMLSPCA